MAFSPSAAFAHERAPGSGVTAVLGPTNTGKTHLAIERMLAHSSGVIGLPLRLLAREVYEIQIAADLERGHVFTDRILHRRGRDETLLLGAATMRPIIERLLPAASIIT